MNRFEKKLADHNCILQRDAVITLQLNVGRKCNQACRHCHVDAAPWRTEMLTASTAARLQNWITTHKPTVVDITGGAPEISEHFQALVKTSRAAGSHVIDRCNLTILEEEGFEWLPLFLKENEVEVIASLPCYQAENVSRQRGNGVFEKSITALQTLNALGFGFGTTLPLHLVYNPIGPTLPSNQAELQAEYKEALQRDFGIVFNKLFTVTNQPIARFAEDLRSNGKWNEYLELLANHFNPTAVNGLMCRDTLSVGYEGELYDCDFNQMLNLPIANCKPLYLWDITPR
ncbi:arsenosugar biosynthesis radical SAM protein ArsS [Verrucomicrobia bacterium]|nr:arsenosugar biosynthesis radical SAM protein ArsS [Verrucomicrobiota bacterium]